VIALVAEFANLKTVKNENPFILGKNGSKLGDGTTFGNEVIVKNIVDKRNIVGIETEIRDRDAIDYPSFGVISNGGRISFKDTGGVFRKYVTDGNVSISDPVDIYLVNTVTRGKEKVGSYLISTISFDPDSMEMELQLTDGMEMLQDFDFEGINPYKYTQNDTNMGISTNLVDIVGEFMIEAKRKTDIGFEYIGETFENMKKISIPTPIVEKSSLWMAFQKSSISSQTHIFKNKNGNVNIAYNGGN
jgi:hypothetical protein